VKDNPEKKGKRAFFDKKNLKAELLEQIAGLEAHFKSLKKKAFVKAGSEKLTGSLRIANAVHGPQFFHITRKGDTKGRYLSVKNPKDMKLARNLAQKDYFEKVQALSEEWLTALEKVERAVQKLPMEASVFSQQAVRRSLVSPLESEMTDEEFFRKWQAVEYKGKPMDENSVYVKTNRGEMVRSKSECLMANKLETMGIPYRYEFPLRLKVNECKIIVYPDFIILGPNRREVIIEHFGMMEIPEYSEKAVRKINTYAMNGFFEGENLLLTYETKNCPFDVQILEKKLFSLFQRTKDA